VNHYCVIAIGIDDDDDAACIEARVSVYCSEELSWTADSGWFLKLEFGWQANSFLPYELQHVRC
jgi:hypothetical protein